MSTYKKETFTLTVLWLCVDVEPTLHVDLRTQHDARLGRNLCPIVHVWCMLLHVNINMHPNY
jgi:hypothetical protein